MFGFDRDEDGSEERWADDRVKVSGVRSVIHWAWWWVHNCVSHPLIGFFLVGVFFRFHDWTSRRMHP